MRVLVTGGLGQLGSSIKGTAEALFPGEFEVIPIGRDDVDVTDPKTVDSVVGELIPDAIINAAAYTNVDGAEDNVDAATEVNALAVQTLAEICLRRCIRLAHVSTDYVFDGTASAPIGVDERANPLSVYGRTKLAGEVSCRDVLGDLALVVRTSWVYASKHPNFVATMLRIMRRNHEITVVADQFGTPTWTTTLAEGLLRLLASEAGGTFHLTDSGATTWHEFASAIAVMGHEKGLIDHRCAVRPITTAEYPTRATRPHYSVLDKSLTFERLQWKSPDWRDSLGMCLDNWQDPKSL